MKYTYLTVGGTFDHFHNGHKALLDRAFEMGEQVYLGITTDDFASQKFPIFNSQFPINAPISNFQLRKKGVEEYLRQKDWFNKVQIVPIEDRFGSTLVDEKLDAIVVSPETELVATEINLLRAQKNWSALEVIVVPWVLAHDGKPIHSVRIRNGEIDREGGLYSLPNDWGVRKLPDSLREELKIPMGTLIKETDHDHEGAVEELITSHPELVSGSQKMPKQVRHDRLFISVGDAITDALLKAGVTPTISIVDLKIQRKPVYKEIAEIGFRGDFVHRKVKNPAGTLSFESFTILNTLVHSESKPSVLQVDGEEDLLALLAIFCAQLGSLIVYGLPSIASPVHSEKNQMLEGVVVVEVSEEIKTQVRNWLENFVLSK